MKADWDTKEVCKVKPTLKAIKAKGMVYTMSGRDQRALEDF